MAKFLYKYAVIQYLISNTPGQGQWWLQMQMELASMDT